MMELEKGRVLKCLRTDKGLEFLSREFENFCLEKGIKRHKSVPLNPQQNGVAKRANRTIMERVRCLLFALGMDKKFWVEASANAVKLVNMCPSSSINGDTPNFRWYGRSDDYSKLRIFGCKAFAHLRQNKLEARALRCVMLGYEAGVKGYRLWCIESEKQKVVVSRDVVFVENVMPLNKSNKNLEGSKEIQKETPSFEIVPQSTFQGGANTDSDSNNDQIRDDTTQGGAVDGQEEDHTNDSDGQDGLRNYQLARDRVRRHNIRPPTKFLDSEMLYLALCVAEQIYYSEPSSYAAAMQCEEKDQWLKAMIEEIDSLIKNGTWILVNKVEGRKIISCKWLFKKKIEFADG